MTPDSVERAIAHLIPSDIPHYQRSGWHVPEMETLNTLRARMPADYTVFHGVVHGVRLTREGFRTAAFGELDFVIVNGAGTPSSSNRRMAALSRRRQTS